MTDANRLGANFKEFDKTNKPCPICRILFHEQQQRERSKRFKGTFDKAIVSITKNRLIYIKHLQKGMFCSLEHFEKGIEIKKFYKQTDKEDLDNYLEKIEQLNLQSEHLSVLIASEWKNGGSPLVILQYAQSIVRYNKKKARYVALVNEITRRIRTNEATRRITAFDILLLIKNETPPEKTDKTTDDQLLKAALSFQATGSLSVAGKLHKMALQRIEENQMDTDGFDFSSLDSDFPATEGTGE